MINVESPKGNVAYRKSSSVMRKVLANFAVVATAASMMLLGAATMSLLGSESGAAKPMVAVLFALYLLLGPSLVLWTRKQANASRSLSVTSVCGGLLFFLGGMLLG